MADSPTSHGSSAPLASQPCSKTATYVDFVNPLLWVLFTNFAFSLGPSILKASHFDDVVQVFLLSVGMFLFIISKSIEAMEVTPLILAISPLSGRIVTTTSLLAANVGLLAPFLMSDFTLFEHCRFMLWSVTFGAIVGICMAFWFSRSGFSNMNGDRDLKGDREY
ncbi:hypothetical protein V1505DRAFT_227896 [Lipomyces doorenjongii]